MRDQNGYGSDRLYMGGVRSRKVELYMSIIEKYIRKI